MNDKTSRPSLRLSATLLLVGQLLYIVVTQFHADGDANNHPAVFAEYAGSGIWTAVHVGQFAGMAILLAGLLALFFALDVQAGTASWAGRFGAASAVVTLALYGVAPGGGRGRPQAGRERVGERPGRREGGALRERRGDPLARVGGEELPELRAGPRFAPVRGRGRADGAGPAADRLPDGALRPHLPGAGLGGRLRGLLANARRSPSCWPTSWTWRG